MSVPRLIIENRITNFIPIEDLVDGVQECLRELYTNDFLEPIGYCPIGLGHSRILCARKVRTGDKDYYIYMVPSSHKEFAQLTEKDTAFVAGNKL
jgi:hypothetical protein